MFLPMLFNFFPNVDFISQHYCRHCHDSCSSVVTDLQSNEDLSQCVVD